jgi:hypothetical protein
MKLYAFYFEDKDIEQLEKIKTFISISTLVKIIEDKFVGAKILKDRRYFTDDEEKMIKEFEAEWHNFKQQNLAHPPLDIEHDLNEMREMLDKIYVQY